MKNKSSGTKDFKIPAYYNLGLLFNCQQLSGWSLEDVAKSAQYDLDTVNMMISFFEQLRDMNIDITKQLHDGYLDSLQYQLKELEEMVRRNSSF